MIGISLFRQCLVVVGFDNDAIAEPSGYLGWITVRRADMISVPLYVYEYIARIPTVARTAR